MNCLGNWRDCGSGSVKDLERRIVCRFLVGLFLKLLV